MAKNVTGRRRVLKGGLAAAGLGLFGLPDWAMPALAQGETLVPFTDYPANFATNPSEVVRVLDIRTIAGAITPKDQFFTTQHYGHPTIDAAAFRLKVSGLVDRPKSLSIDDLKGMGKEDLVAGFECSGNGRGRIQGFASNGRFTGVPLRKVLKEAGLKDEGHEVVFFGADHGEEETEFRQQKIKLDQSFGRSLPRELALSSDPLVAYAMNGEPLTKHQGAPLRLIMPGWYGVANVKWLSRIHVQRDPFMG
jgi:DMSO/TMAO reductase YedYZ molybdopterin-dependent catalytic subunit